MGKQRRFKNDPNEEIGPKYNVAAWKKYGRTKKLKGGFSFDDSPDVQGALIKKKDGIIFKPSKRDEHNVHARKTEGSKFLQKIRQKLKINYNKPGT